MIWKRSLIEAAITPLQRIEVPQKWQALLIRCPGLCTVQYRVVRNAFAFCCFDQIERDANFQGLRRMKDICCITRLHAAFFGTAKFLNTNLSGRLAIDS